MKIDIERLIDAELEEMDAINAYYHFGKKKYDWYRNDYEAMREKGEELYHDEVHTRWQMYTLMDVLRCKEWKKVYIIARAVRKWRERNEYRCLSSKTQDKIGKFIFGKEYTEDERLYA